MPRVSTERKNLNRLAGEFLVASRLAQRGYMVSLQWGTTIGYDILAFDKNGNVAFIEVKSSAAYSRRWVLQKKYANPREDALPIDRRFVCCVDLAQEDKEPTIYVFPAAVVADGLHYYFNGKFPDSDSYHLSLDFRPQGTGRNSSALKVGEFIASESYVENFAVLKLNAVVA